MMSAVFTCEEMRNAPGSRRVSDLCGVDVQLFQERSSQDLPNSRVLSV